MLFVDANREKYGVEPICRMLPIAPSTYYEQKAREKDPSRQPARAKRDVQGQVLIFLSNLRTVPRARLSC